MAKQLAIKLNNLRQYNFSQGIVVRNNKIVSIEGKDGTKKMLEKSISKKFRNRGVLVKFPKKKQDLRIDLPTIGLKTIKQSKNIFVMKICLILYAKISHKYVKK